MGSCVSVHKNPDSKIRYKFTFGSKTHNNLSIPSPVKDFPANGETPAVGVKSFGDSGSKDENFFDSQPWLESDCEEDFLSVNGDFTPSRGNTPVHHKFSAGTPKVIKPVIDNGTPPGSLPEPSPTKKKRLSELFQDSIGGEKDDNAHILSNNQQSPKEKTDPNPKSGNGTPYVSEANSIGSSERTPNQKSMRSVHCCLPNLMSSRSFNDGKKMSPARSGG